jgi:hypothetical protein
MTPIQLSFHNLIEAYLLRSLRVDHGVGIKEMRAAISYRNRQTLK